MFALDKKLKISLQIVKAHITLLIGNRFVPASHKGSVKLFGKVIRYGNRGSLYGMFKEIFVEQNYYMDPTDEPIKILDCGSNIGMSLLYFRLMAPNAHIVAFEPNPYTFSILSENISRNNLDVTLHNVGLSAEHQASKLYTDDQDLSSQSASVTKHLETKKRNLQEVEVNLVKLSEYINGEIDILKLDIEGSEGEVLEELASSGKLPLIKNIFIEYHYDGINTAYPLGNVLSLLEKAGCSYVVASNVRFPFRYKAEQKNYSYKIVAWRK